MLKSAHKPAARRLAPQEYVIYLGTLKCQIIRIFPEKNEALVKFSNSLDRKVPLNTLTRPEATPRIHD